MKRWAGFIPLVWTLCACNVASVREAPNTIAYNQCQSNNDCGGGVCSAAHQCRSRSATFQNLLFEVTPPADGSVIAGVQFLVQEKDIEGDTPISLVLDPISQVVGMVTAKERKCDLKFVNDIGTVVTSMDASVPARVSLVPTTTALGLYSPPSVVQSALVNEVYWGFSLNVPPGKYDLYVEPNPQQDESCPVPPQLVRGNPIDPGILSLDIDLPEPSLFDLHVTWPPEDGALDGWIVDMLDPVSGRVISNRVKLALQRGSKSDYRATLAYSSVSVVGQASAQPQDPLFRLSPPEGSADSAALPTVFMARSALAVFDAKSGTLADFTSLPQPVHVHGQVTSGSRAVPVSATVTLVAKSIPEIAPGVLASFVRTVEAGTDGQFDVYLPPGQYDVSTVPRSSVDSGRKDETPLAADTRVWTVPSAPAEQAGKVIELGTALRVTGSVFASTGPVATAQVQAVASPASIQQHALEYTLGGSATSPPRPAFVPRASAGGVARGGEFELRADPGTFDITVRPNTDTGFAWLVLPNYPITSLTAGLGTMTMPLPVSYGGTVTVQGAEGPKLIPSALIRAYIYLKGNEYTTDSAHADSVLQVAETRADSEGAFEILIPAELNQGGGSL